jgi:cytochrome c oxidase subunit 3
VGNVFSASTNDHRLPGTGPSRWSRERAARWFFALGVAAVTSAVALSVLLIKLLGRPAGATFHIPAAFAASTLLLGVGSVLMASALRAVRWERQELFRKRLAQAVAAGILFMGTQTYALWTILPAERSANLASLGVAPFAVMLAAVHALHFLVATLFVTYIAVQAHAGRYDHEYHWGVTFCAWFWHVLGIVWMAILAVYSIVVW